MKKILLMGATALSIISLSACTTSNATKASESSSKAIIKSSKESSKELVKQSKENAKASAAALKSSEKASKEAVKASKKSSASASRAKKKTTAAEANSKASEKAKVSTTTPSPTKSTAPISLSAADLQMSGKDFYKKYEGKTVQFDGVLIFAQKVTSSLSDLAFSTGKSGNSTFSDGSGISMIVGKYNLPALNQNWATDPGQFSNDMITLNQYPIVHVTGTVRGYKDDTQDVDLMPINYANKAAAYPTGENWSK